MTDHGTIPELILLSDEPVASVTGDKLEMGTYAQIIAGAALHTPGPFTIGVFGKWGEGKTSLLRLAKSLLDDAPSKPITVWFNAWQYDHEEHPLVPLALAIAEAVDLATPEAGNLAKLCKWMAKRSSPTNKLAKWMVKWSGKTSKFGQRTATRREIAAALRTLVAGLTLSVPPLSLAGKDALAELDKLTAGDASYSFGTSIYQRAFTLLENAGGRFNEAGVGERPPIVVFIDDLDRCTPDRALKLLQSIRLVLGQPGFVFVIALDQEPVVQHLIDVYEKLKMHDPDAAGQAYLDKIVQLPLWVPSHQSAFPDYLEHLLKTDAVRANSDVAAVLKNGDDWLEGGTDANPRALVRLINNLIVDSIVLGDRTDEAEDWLGLCAVSRLLRGKLGSGPYLKLVRDNRLCEELAGSSAPANEDWRITGKMARAERTPEADLRFTVLRLREHTPAIAALLNSPLGKRWLIEHRLRREIDQFLTIERREATATESGKALIDRAIRSSLTLGDDTPITAKLLETVKKLNLDFERGIVDDDLAYVAQMTSLTELSLSNTSITDAGLEQLKGLTSLTDLYLSDTSITDAGLEQLQGLTSLTELYLSDTSITDAGLEWLKGLTSLERLHLRRTSVMEAGKQALKQALPNLRIYG